MSHGDGIGKGDTSFTLPVDLSVIAPSGATSAAVLSVWLFAAWHSVELTFFKLSSMAVKFSPLNAVTLPTYIESTR